ncbi:MAG: ABC transporter ATP-binding protein [Nitratireductor sp.]|nr:ABC transporter ATP-binding protein [Nitratireductor sp.]
MMLQVNSLHSHYGLSHVLQGIDFSLEAGEVFGVFGRNGVGKTTLLKNIAGWVKPTSGSIIAAGKDITGKEPDAVNRAGIALVPEDRRIFPGLSVRENMELGLLGRQQSGGEAALEAVLDRFPRLKERAGQAGTTLSGGEQQMLAIARIMVADPQIVLVDEPSEGLAPMIVAEVFAAIHQMRDEGKSVVLVEQNIHEALAVCDRFIAIERGQVVMTGHAENSADQAKLLEIVSV